MEPQVQWAAPVALWPSFAPQTQQDASRAAFRAPSILRFATDAFMPEYMAVLQNQPGRLGEWLARPEKWQQPSAQPAPIEELPPLLRRLERLRLATATPLNAQRGELLPAVRSTGAGKLKLFQPGHMRFYLVSAALVCRQPGLPDRTVDAGAGERVGYVVRRLRLKPAAAAAAAATGRLPAEFNLTNSDEYAFVDGKYWVKASAGDLVTGEEVNPMFGVTYVDTTRPVTAGAATISAATAGAATAGQKLPKRRALSGVIPVGKRETYMAATIGRPGAAGPAEDDATELMDPRKAHLAKTVTGPWRKIIETVKKAEASVGAKIPSGLDQDGGDVQTAENELAKAASLSMSTWLSWLVLIDFGDFLATYVKPVWKVITHAETVSTLTTGSPQRTLYDAMEGAKYTDPDPKAGTPQHSLAWALNQIQQSQVELDSTKDEYGGEVPPPAPFPNWRFPLHEPALRSLVDPVTGPTLDDLVVAAFDENPEVQPPPLPLAAAMSRLDSSEPGWFIIRCVFERPNCVPITAPLLSEASQSFQMAAFFDPEAPARPIRINLPMDTTPAGLRKFDRNTAFMISDALCGQMARMGSLTLADLVLSVLPWPLHRDLPGGKMAPCADGSDDPEGMICSLSIPIITICALILLMIIVSLLDFIFRWLPFFILCFPARLFGAKEAQT